VVREPDRGDPHERLAAPLNVVGHFDQAGEVLGHRRALLGDVDVAASI
jgi:hypothetical protein